jgi:phage tail sheath protein FI
VSREPPVRQTIAGGPTAITAIVGTSARRSARQPRVVRSSAEFDAQFGPEPSPLGDAVRQFFAAGGTHAIAVATKPGDVAAGLTALQAAGPFGLLCLAEPADAAVRQAACALVRDQRALFIVDPEPAWNRAPVTLEDFNAGMALENSALYFPRAEDGGAVSAAVAGTIARLDAAHGIAKAPAGRDARLLGIDALAAHIDDREGERINALGINVLRDLSGVGPVIWGARTLANDGDWKYVTIRRMALYVEQTLDAGLQWVVFEPNAEPLWEHVRLDVGDFLFGLWHAGTLLGGRAEEAFFVRCDRTTMTQADIDGGRLVAIVGFAALRPAEFVILRMAFAATPPSRAR